MSQTLTSRVVVASDGQLVPVDDLAQVIVRNGDGSVNYIQVVHVGNTYRQTLTYTTGAVTGISAWVKQ